MASELACKKAPSEDGKKKQSGRGEKNPANEASREAREKEFRKLSSSCSGPGPHLASSHYTH